MGNINYFLLLICFCLIKSKFSAPLSSESGVDADFCTGDDFLKYENGREYSYDYSTQTDLWINDVSEESKSSVELKAKVFVRSVQPCLYLLRLESASITGESINQQSVENVVQNLNDNSVQFRLNSRGELDSTVDFTQGDSAWSRNIKRGILSALQLRPLVGLRNVDQSSETTDDAKSAVVYETDVLGRCRTTYLVNNPSAADLLITKRKSLQRCTLNENSKTSAVQYVPYKNIPEFYQGRLFVETHECTTQVKNGLIQQVNCEEHSTYKVGSRGLKGVQAVVKQTLTYLNVVSGYDRRAHGPFESNSVKFEFTDKSVDDSEYRNFDVDNYLSDLCSRVQSNSGLDVEHSNNFRALVNTLESKSKNDLYNLYASSKAKCDLAGLTVSQALVFANSENSLETVLRLLDENAFSNQGLINEYPVLTALARLQEPSLRLLENLKAYLEKKTSDFVYLKKLYLVYSSLVKSYCSKNECDEKILNNFSSIFDANLGSNCADSANTQLVTTSLKAIGNIGSFNNLNTLVQCALNKANNLETRISAVQSFRRFDVQTILSRARGLIDLLKNTNEDTELRINAFQVLIRAVDTDVFQAFARDSLSELLEKETDYQFLTYVVDFAKERGLTVLLNPILSNQQLKEKFSVNFKEVSWNNFKYRYSLNRDGALELDTSVIYASDRSFIPRSIRFNATMHLFGMSINSVDVTLRTEGLEDILKSVLVDKLTSEQLLKRLMSSPEELIDIVKAIADKLKYTQDKPFFSVLIRVYGSDVFYSELDSLDKLKRLSDFLRNPRENLIYAQVNTVKNMFLVDSRVRQPLLNGFEFNTFMDTSLGLLLVKKSSKTDSNEIRDFNVNNFYSVSLAINKRFEIQINKDNKLSLKKKAVVNGRLRLDINGQKKADSVVYNWNLTPLEDISLLVVDGKFFKLSANAQYKEVTKFSVERHSLEKCTSENFHNGLGIDLCISVDRPRVGSLVESLKPVDLDEILNDFDDDDDDDNDDEDGEQSLYGSTQRPKLILSGPYHYEVRLKNPEKVKTLILNGQRTKTDESSKTLTASLKTVSFSNEIKNRLEFAYSRSRADTNRGIERHLSIELKNAESQDVRLKISGDVVFKTKQILNIHLELQNKILREINLNLNVLREINDQNIMPTYNVEALLDSKLINNKYRRYTFNIKPIGRNIESNLLIEKSDVSSEFKPIQIAKASLILKSKNENKIDYDVELKSETSRPSSLIVTGSLAADLFKSDVELSVKYSGPRFELDEPATIKFGHVIDLSSAESPSFVEFGVKLPSREVDHNVKLIFKGNPVEMKLNRLEIQLTTPKSHAKNNGLPFIIYLEKNENTNLNGIENSQITVGLENFLIDLATRESKVAKSLIKLDANSIVRSVAIEYVRNKDLNKRSLEISLRAKKNGVNFANVQFTKSGSLSDLRTKPAEVPRQSLNTNLQIKAFENSASADAKLDFESSVKNKKYLLNFDFRTDGLLKILLKLISIKARFNLNGAKIDSEYEMKKIGEVRSFGFATKKDAQIRSGSNGFNEFDIEYTKVLGSNQQLKSPGTVRYQFKDLKNFEASLDINKNFRFNAAVKNERKLQDKIFGVHDIRLKYAHLDVYPVEREYALYINNEAQPNTLVLNVLAKKSQPNKLDSNDDLDYILDLKTNNRFWYEKNGQRRLENAANTLVLKSKKLNFDINAQCNALASLRSNQFNLESSVDAKFPAFLSEPGKVNTLKHKLTLNKDFKGERKSFASNIETDNKFVTRVFKTLNVEYSRERVSLNLTNVNAKINFVNQNDEAKFVNLSVERTHCDNGDDSIESNVNEDESKEDNTEQILTGSNKFKKLCSGTKLNLQQNLLSSANSRLIEGKVFDTSDCTLITRLVRNKQVEPSYIYNLDVLLSAECKNLVFLKEALNVRRYSESSRSDKTTTELSLEVQSDLYFKSRSVQIKHKKFYANNGLFEIKWNRDSAKLFLINLEYNRELDSQTNKLTKGKYSLNTELGSSIYKNCDLNIEAKNSYYNSLNCRIKTTRLPVELSYGYSLKVSNIDQLPNGKQDAQLTINLPSTRQLRVEYDSQRSILTQQEQFDDDEDDNNNREFSSTIKYFWDFSKDQSKVLLVKLRRDNYSKTNSKFTAEANSPSFKSLKLVVDRKRLFNETDIVASISYELDNRISNEIQVNSKLTSNFDTSHLSLELSLSRPNLNILYENRFNKLNGRLQYLSIRLGKLLKFSVDKEYDPENRLIRLELVSPDEAKFKVETKSQKTSRNVYIVTSTLRSLPTNNVLSSLESRFDSNSNVFDVNVNAIQSKQQYSLNFGFYNESLANAAIRHVSNNNQVLGSGSVQIVNINDEEISQDSDNRYVQFSLKWNRLWNKIHADILANQGIELKAVEVSGFNSYLGDVYGSLVDDLKFPYEKIRAERRQVKEELKQVVLLLADFYSNALPTGLKEDLLRNFEARQILKQQEQNKIDELPLHKRLFVKYNNLAKRVNSLHFKIRKFSKKLSDYIPRLTIISYNNQENGLLNRMANQYDNYLVAQKPINNARNLYQLNAEYRDRLRRLSNRFLTVKSGLLRNLGGANLRALVNKYKLRRINDFTMVAHIFNRRNLVTFNGESRVLKARCRFLLAHELTKNQFSVILNSNNDKASISISAYGQPSIDINSNQAFINNKQLSLPYAVELKDKNAKILVKRSHNSVSVQVNHDLLVTCYDDSKSCSVALTRWYTGKVNGLLGRSNYNLDQGEEDHWYLEKSCKLPNFQPKQPSDDAVKTCYSIFGKHRRAVFRNALQAINPVGWQKLCELALNADINNKCAVMKAFVNHAKLRKIEVNEPNDCFQCQTKSKSVLIGQKYAGPSADMFVNGNDFVFVLLPCDKSKYSLDLSASAKGLSVKNPLNRYYFVKVHENNGASIYQSESGQSFNFDVKKAQQTMGEDKTSSDLKKDDFYSALFLAGSMFANRQAKNRYLIIVGCGNCLRYSSKAAVLLDRLLTKRNIVVSSWDDYNIVDSDLTDETIIGYGQGKVFLNKQGTTKVETDSIDSFKFEHRANLCSRLASKTNGNVFNINHIKKPEIFQQVAQHLAEIKSETKYETRLDTCERVDTPFGDVDDFSYKRFKIVA